MSATVVDASILRSTGVLGRAVTVGEALEVLVAAANNHAGLINSFTVGVPYLDVTTFGALAGGDAETNRAAFQSAMSAAVVLGARLYVPPAASTYHVGRNGSTSYSLDVPGDRLTIFGTIGSVVGHPVGMPNASVAIFRVNERDRVLFQGLTIDGNWGNTVGGTDSQAGLNHATQADPKNFGIMVRGSTNVTIVDCHFRQMYGDAIWSGGGATTSPAPPVRNLNVTRCTAEMCARNSFSLGGFTLGATVRDCDFDTMYTTGIDGEPQGDLRPVRDIVVDNVTIGKWWAGTVSRPAMSFAGASNGCHEDSAARGIRITNCRIAGPVLLANVVDVTIEKSRIVLDFDIAAAKSPVFIRDGARDVVLDDLYIYDRAAASGDSHSAAITVYSPLQTNRPSSVTIRNCRIHARNGMNGVTIDGPGGQASEGGTATAVSATTLTDTAKSGGSAWTTDEHKNAVVRMGGATAVVEGNTSDTLALTAWVTALGDATATPATGAYELLGRGGIVSVVDCKIDCGNDGYSAGGFGIFVDNGNFSSDQMYVSLKNNEIRNATADAINIKSRAGNAIKLLEIVDNKAIDDQVTPTCATAVRFQTSPAVNISKLIMRGTVVDGVAAKMAGLTTQKWLLEDGDEPRWTGFGTPESAVAAPVGSTFLRKDGGASTTLYVKTSGTGNTGWTAK